MNAGGFNVSVTRETKSRRALERDG